MGKKKKVYLREGSWLAQIAAKKLGARQLALVIGNTIHLHNTSATKFMSQRSWLLHELKHVVQYERHGVPGFLWRYMADSFKNGYQQNRFEIEARNAENETTLLEQFELVLPVAKNKSKG